MAHPASLIEGLAQGFAGVTNRTMRYTLLLSLFVLGLAGCAAPAPSTSTTTMTQAQPATSTTVTTTP